MERKNRGRIKFSNIDVLDFMGKVVQEHTRYYQSDFLIDREMISKAADRKEQQEKTFIWLCRTSGTWCLLEKNVLIEDTGENSIFNFYAGQTDDIILAFAVELKGKAGRSVTGNVYALDYRQYHDHVRSVSLKAGTVLLGYEDGERIQRADMPISSQPDIEYGKLKSIQYRTHPQGALSDLLSREQQERGHFKESDPYRYIEDM